MRHSSSYAIAHIARIPTRMLNMREIASAAQIDTVSVTHFIVKGICDKPEN